MYYVQYTIPYKSHIPRSKEPGSKHYQKLPSIYENSQGGFSCKCTITVCVTLQGFTSLSRYLRHSVLATSQEPGNGGKYPSIYKDSPRLSQLQTSHNYVCHAVGIYDGRSI